MPVKTVATGQLVSNVDEFAAPAMTAGVGKRL
jgi:hypothetical protein